MMERLLSLSDRDLAETANSLRSGRLIPPFSAALLPRILSREVATVVAQSLQQLHNQGFTPDQIAITLDMLCSDRKKRVAIDDLVELVTTSPELSSRITRDTGVVVRDLFSNANDSVLIAGFAVYQGQKLFQTLADRMLARPDLKVRLFLDIQRPTGDTSSESALVSRFAHRFRETQWPLDRPIPEIYFDPRSLELDAGKKASLHAKTIIVDSRRVFVTSANFTEAAQQRNIEIGLLLDSPMIAAQLTDFLEHLRISGHFQSAG